MRFRKPIDGDVLFPGTDGEQQGIQLWITVEIEASRELPVTINGIPAIWEEGCCRVKIPLKAGANIVSAENPTEETVSATLFWFPGGSRAWRLGIDDVIRCLENLNRHDEYRSIFEDPFFALLQQVHQQTGMLAHLHLFYQNEDGSFNLSMMTNRFREEFRANSNWLRMTFHSRAEFPDSPYRCAPYEQVLSEGRQAAAEITRFAGEEVQDGATSQHWADSALPGTRAFRDLGFRVLDGYFTFDEKGNPYVSYYLNKEQTAHAFQRDFWADTTERIFFVKDDLILDQTLLPEIESALAALAAGDNGEFLYLLIHEQYFYPDYRNYQPEYGEKLLKAARWCAASGYHPAFLTDFVMEAWE